MAVPRPVLLALLGLAVVMAAFLATRGNQEESVTQPPAAAPKTAPAPKAEPSKADGKSSRAKARPATPPKAEKPKPAAAPGVPPQVQKAASALARNEVVVFFFSKPGAADDTGARVAMRSLDGMKRVNVFRAGIDQIAHYRPMLSGLGISQVPATAIVRPGRRAVLIQGYVDAGTLRQNVADALR